jgi:hypothetical protein
LNHVNHLINTDTLMNIRVFIILFAFLSCARDSFLKVPEINMNPENARNYQLADVFTDIEIVPLETQKQTLINSISQLSCVGDTLIINDNQNLNFQSVKMFHKSGFYIGHLGKYGKGPDEIQFLGNIQVDQNKNIVYLQDISNKRKIYTYNLENEILGDYVIKAGYPVDFAVLPQNGGIYTFMNPMRTKSSDNIHSYKLSRERQGIVFEQFRPYNYGDLYILFFRIHRSRFINYSDNIHYYEQYFDTIFKISLDGLSPIYKLNFGSNWVSEKDLLELKNEADFRSLIKKRIYSYEPSESNNYLIINFLSKKSDKPVKLVGIYDKRKAKSIIIGKLGKELNLIELCSQYFMTGDNELCMVIEPYRIKQALEELKKMNITLTGIEKELEQIMQGVKAEDNPILIFAQLNE